MKSQVWPSPAKLNLFLHVTGRRQDGYHELQTLFQILEFGDSIKFTENREDQVRLVGTYPGIEKDENLIFKAAYLLKQQCGTARGIQIELDKRIPLGGGLGGGSSNAATTLVALNHIWNAGLSVDELAEMGLGLGADVPVFIRGRSAWAEGIGERLKPVDLPESWYVVVYPGCHVNTGEIFNSPDLTRNTSPITISDFENGSGHNDCEPVVFKAYPEIARAHEWLSQWTQARMTGTGSCVFGRFNNESDANAVLGRTPDEWQGFVSRGVNRSPLMEHMTDPIIN